MSKLGVQKRRGLRRELTTVVVSGQTTKGKICSECGVAKPLDDFGNEAKGFMGKKTKCKKCYNKYNRQYKRENQYQMKIYNINYRKENREKVNRRWREWEKKNIEVARAIKQRRRARKRALPATLTKQQIEHIIKKFNKSCALTGDTDVHLDHFIPVATGHGGTTLENTVPLQGELNQSKSDRNPFVWYVEVRQRFGLSDEKWRLLIEYLANLNEMTTFEYTAYVYECFANPNEIGNRLETA